MSELVWGDATAPPVPSWLKTPFLNIDKDGAVLRLLGKPERLTVHYVAGRTRPHAKTDCAYCPAETREVHYAPAQVWGRGRDSGTGEPGRGDFFGRVLCLPDGSAAAFRDPLLIGRVAHVKRLQKGRQSVVAIINPDDREMSPLILGTLKAAEACARKDRPCPPPFDVRAVVEYFWYKTLPADLAARAEPEPEAEPEAADDDTPSTIPFRPKTPTPTPTVPTPTTPTARPERRKGGAS